MTYDGNNFKCVVKYIRIIARLPIGVSGMNSSSSYIKVLVYHYQVLSC
jgi:hypothetical protein